MTTKMTQALANTIMQRVVDDVEHHTYLKELQPHGIEERIDNNKNYSVVLITKFFGIVESEYLSDICREYNLLWVIIGVSDDKIKIAIHGSSV